MPITKSIPSDLKLTDILQLCLTNLGDGFFAFKGDIDVNGVTRRIKDINGEVIPGTGLDVFVRDYTALIDGSLITDKNKEKLEPNRVQAVTIPSVGTWYICLAPQEFLASDGVKRKDFDRGLLAARASAPAINSGEILAAKVVIPEGTSQVTAAMIDNSVKDYLIDLDEFKYDVDTKISDVMTLVSASVLDAINLLREEIADGDSEVLAQVETLIANVQAELDAATLNIEDLRADLTALSEYVSTTIQSRIDTISSDLNSAVINLTQLVNDETSFLQSQISANVDALANLHMIVDAPTTGLVDRVEVLESRPPVPPELIDTVEDLESRVDALELQVANSLVVNDSVDPEDVDTENSDVTIRADGKFTLPEASVTTYWEDTFDTNGPVDPTKYNTSGVVVVEDQQLKVLDLANGVYGSVNKFLDQSYTKDFAVSCSLYAKNSRSGYNNVPAWGLRFGAWFMTLNFVHVDTNFLGIYVLLYNTHAGTNPINWYYMDAPTYFSDKNINTGASFPFRFIFEQPTITVQYNGSTVVSVTDPNYITSGAFTYMELRSNSLPSLVVAYDNLKITSPTSATYSLSGTLQTNQLASASTILKAAAGWVSDAPAGTAVTAQMSLDGGSNWVAVTASELIDGSVEPWNSAGDDLRVKFSLTSDNTEVTPVLGPIAVSSSRM